MRAALNAFQLLTEWISFLWAGLPAKLRPTMLELLFGAMISRTGHIMDALLSIQSKRTWTTYFKAIQKGKFSWLKLVQRWIQLLLKLFGNQLTLALDDFITVRASQKAPSVAFHHDHAKRVNRPQFLWGQLRVSLGIICFRKGKSASLPLMMRLIRTDYTF